MDLLCSNGSIWLHSLFGEHSVCAELRGWTQSKETPSAFHVTEGSPFSIFNSDISSDSVISQSSPGGLKRRERWKDGGRDKLENSEYWPTSNGPVKWSSSHYAMCNLTGFYFATQMQCCSAEIGCVKSSGDQKISEYECTVIVMSSKGKQLDARLMLDRSRH